jgi:mutator protein MutT
MMIDQKLLQDKVSKYEKEHLAYKAYADFLKAVLANACKRMMPYAIIEARPKEIASFAEKVVRKQEKYHRDPGYDITDRCGARVVTQTTREKDMVCEYIRKHFLIDEANSIDKKSELKDDQFGYLGMHYVVQIKEGVREMEGIPVDEAVLTGAKGFKAEIQVKTMLEHAWANPLHDRLYKVALKVRPAMKRDAAGLMALIEDADARIGRLADQVDSFLGHYAAFLRPDELEMEIAIVKALLDCEQYAGKGTAPADPCSSEVKAKLHLRLGKLTSLTGKRKEAIEEWEKGMACRAKNQDALKLELGYALCQEHRQDADHPVYARGQAMLGEVADRKPNKSEVETASQGEARAEALHRLAWTYGNLRGKEKQARDRYREALDLAPGNPYHFAAYLGYEVFCSHGLKFIRCMRDYVTQAIETCKAHIDVGIEQPRAQFTMGRLYLLLDSDQEAMDAYLRAIHLLMDAKSYTPVEALDDELGFLESINLGEELPPKHDQISRLLRLARAAKRLQKGLGYDLKDAMSEEAKAGKLGSPRRALIVVGGAGFMPEAKKDEYRKVVAWALVHADADGVVCSGGTAVGIPGVVGEEVQRLREANAKAFTLVGYLPQRGRLTVSGDGKRYDLLIQTQGDDFGPLEPIQGWVDLLGSGLSPGMVRVLGIEGGKVAAVEYRLALALGAKLAVIPGSGREADAILRDPEWSKSPNLIRLPMSVIDEATMRAFVRPSLMDIKDPKKLDELAELVHVKYLANTPYSDVDPVRRRFDRLRDDLKESNRQQILYAAEILASQGFDVKFVGDKEPIVQPEFTLDEVDNMAALEHGRWSIERLAAGWSPGPRKDVNAKINPSLVTWENLPDGPDGMKKYDRIAIGDYAEHLRKAGYQIVHSGEPRRPVTPLAMSVKVLLRNDKGEILLLQRSKSSKNNAGKWDFPGGKVDSGEELTAALVREVKEETGLAIRLNCLAGSFQSYPPGRIVVYLALDAELAAGQSSDDVHLSEEHSAHQWAPAGSLAAVDLCPQFLEFARTLKT